ncbi:Hypothetical protein PEIBARAKI_4262 [Petrimonas sp. IBARAKI]|nr:Hypothetical protein PEIBARAKI_4262 [Petrimonas sp. IBARAKI]
MNYALNLHNISDNANYFRQKNDENVTLYPLNKLQCGKVAKKGLKNSIKSI